jgi:glycosyltransferase involved in cell wall biosynthesis
MTERPTVGIVCAMYGPPWNEGEKNMARALELGLPAHGFSPRVYCNRAHDNMAPVRHRPSPWKIATSLRFWHEAGRAARRDGARVVHLVTSLSSILGLKCAVIRASSGAPLLLHVTGLSQPLRGHRFLLSADRVVVGGAYLKPWFPEALELPPVSPHVKINGVAPRCAEGPGRRLLYMGSMEPVRGVHTLADALGLLRQRGQLGGIRLTIAWNGLGRATYADGIRARLAAHGVEDVVRWEGVASDVPALYDAHDLVVIPRASGERMGFPLRMLEALSRGRPVVTSDVGEMPTVAAGCGLVFRRGDVTGLADALHQFATDTALYARCATMAGERSAAYSPDATIGRIASVYRDLIDERAPLGGTSEDAA